MKAGYLLSLLCTVTGHCTATGLYAEIYDMVSKLFFQCFPHNILSNGVCCAQQMFSIRLLKRACITESSGLCVFGSNKHFVSSSQSCSSTLCDEVMT